ncbi:hypothetical protein L1987_38817 [Smallanthus sonchifolius]|uniref:Uncharacterized protein n=1 Tax=Smallanthus sonchifolius TaxID=185202 RepID=A0ACB9HMS8_9ASTR|nr:hypothetical protein L1987_38817 [Smallanthus sonchifolius]
MADLQCLPPNEQPRVSDHTDQIRDMIQKIINNDCAYTVDGDVYFSVDNFPNYGRLSGRKLEDNRAGEIRWDSPWGPGRPGWHIECSAMSATYLTETFDIHGGGMDLIFPHHENEIAQSCAACPNSNITYWMHNGFVTANDENMSKSIGNFFTIREVTKLYHPLALRHFLMGTHYRSPVNYSIAQIEISSEAIFYIYQIVAVLSLNFRRKLKLVERNICIKNLRSHFEEKMSDDLHTPTILNAALQDALRLMNKIFSMLKVLKQLKEKALKRADLTEENILQRIEERALARKNKDFKLVDQVRSDLTSKGIALMDVGNDTIWRPCVPVEPAKSPDSSDSQEPGLSRKEGSGV